MVVCAEIESGFLCVEGVDKEAKRDQKTFYTASALTAGPCWVGGTCTHTDPEERGAGEVYEEEGEKGEREGVQVVAGRGGGGERETTTGNTCLAPSCYHQAITDTPLPMDQPHNHPHPHTHTYTPRGATLAEPTPEKSMEAMAGKGTYTHTYTQTARQGVAVVCREA